MMIPRHLTKSFSGCSVSLLHQHINDVIHAGPFLWITSNAPVNEAPYFRTSYQAYLALSLLRIWLFPDEHLTQQNTKAINVQLEKETKAK